ncbi:hypothetical protein PHJA_000240200 [Phtheirospermum japonicum]|uniref:Uncharacterized protein n=1 Tax=Phtheirospermum japonicum TaxID=374723 RepID=A0A830B6S1_9LAMI|nr:hypothetical protein PHJA_000240200 [Phtheirospermum japonicum]
MSEVSNPEVIDEVMQKHGDICEVQSKNNVRNEFTSDYEDEKPGNKRTRKRRATNYGSTSSEATSRRWTNRSTQAEFENLKARVKALEDKIQSMETKLQIIEDVVEKIAPGSIQSVIQ